MFVALMIMEIDHSDLRTSSNAKSYLNRGSRSTYSSAYSDSKLTVPKFHWMVAEDVSV